MSPLRSSAGPAVCTNGDAELARRRSAPARSCRGRAGRRAARGRAPRRAPAAACDRDARAAPCSASWPTNSSSRRGRSERVELVLGARVRASGCGRRRRRACGSSPRAAFSAWAIRSSGVLAGRAVEQRVGLLRREAEPEQAVAGERARVVAAGDHDRVVGRRGADLLAQLDDDPLGRALADARHGLQARGVAGRDRARAARAAGRRRARRAPPSGRRDWTPISSRKRSRSSSVAKP